VWLRVNLTRSHKTKEHLRQLNFLTGLVGFFFSNQIGSNLSQLIHS
jgi:hypothetical protein